MRSQKKALPAVSCRQCGGPIPEGGNGRHLRRYCSDACRDAIDEEHRFAGAAEFTAAGVAPDFDEE